MRILMTGAAGLVGQMLAPRLAGDYELRLTDLRPPPDNAGTGEVVLGDLAEPGLARRLCEGVDAVVHLAGNPGPNESWDRLRGPNLDAATAVMEAAAEAGVRRLVLASSVHAMGGYLPLHRRPEPVAIRDDWPPHACCRYGATKIFAEAAGQVYADSGALSVVCLRLGGCRPAPPHAGWLETWLSVADLEQSVRCALSAEVSFGAYTITSANTEGVFAIDAAAKDLDYRPVTSAESYLDGLADGPSTMCAASGPIG